MARTPDHLAVLPEVEAEAVGVRHELGLFLFILLILVYLSAYNAFLQPINTVF